MITNIMLSGKGRKGMVMKLRNVAVINIVYCISKICITLSY